MESANSQIQGLRISSNDGEFVTNDIQVKITFSDGKSATMPIHALREAIEDFCRKAEVLYPAIEERGNPKAKNSVSESDNIFVFHFKNGESATIPCWLIQHWVNKNLKDSVDMPSAEHSEALQKYL